MLLASPYRQPQASPASTKTNPATKTISTIDMDGLGAVGRRAIRKAAAKGKFTIVNPQQALLERAPVTTNVTRSRAMAAAITAAQRVRAGGSY